MILLLLIMVILVQSETEIVTDEEKCCRENGVLDVCFGYCLKERVKTGARSFGICGKWFKLINQCRKDPVKSKCDPNIGLNGNCKFPFTYGGTTYHECTTEDNNGVLWCITTEGDGDWTECKSKCSISDVTVDPSQNDQPAEHTEVSGAPLDPHAYYD